MRPDPSWFLIWNACIIYFYFWWSAPGPNSTRREILLDLWSDTLRWAGRQGFDGPHTSVVFSLITLVVRAIVRRRRLPACLPALLACIFLVCSNRLPQTLALLLVLAPANIHLPPCSQLSCG